MARKIRDSKLESRSARLRLPIRKKPYTGPALARGIHLLYRRNRTNGTWVIKASNGHGGYWTKGFAVADDFEEPDGTHVLAFHQAGDAGKALARGKADTADSKPMTVADALARYKIDLKSRGGHLSNATRVEKHLTSTLAGKPVALLTVRDLQTWRNGLKEKMEPSSVNRTRTGLRAALELAATLDHRITNRHVFRLGLRGLPGSNKARRIVLPDADVLRILKAAYKVRLRHLVCTILRPCHPSGLVRGPRPTFSGSKPSYVGKYLSGGSASPRPKRCQIRSFKQ